MHRVKGSFFHSRRVSHTQLASLSRAHHSHGACHTGLSGHKETQCGAAADGAGRAGGRGVGEGGVCDPNIVAKNGCFIEI